MGLLARAASYLVVVKGALKGADMVGIWEIIQNVVSGVETAVRATDGMSGPEKKAAAKKLILDRVKVPFWKKWILSFILGYVIDAVVAWKNRIYGRFWGSDEPEAGYAAAIATETQPESVPAPAVLSSKIAQVAALKPAIVIDGVTVGRLREAIAKHNETHPDQRVHELGTLAQTALETAHFKSFRGFNLAGIKSTPGWEKVGGKIWSAGTSEFQGGKMVSTKGRFRSYDDLAHFLDDYSGLIHRCYAVTARNLDCIWLYLAGFYKGKYGAWATDPKYYEKLCAMVVRYAPEVLGEEWQTRLADSFQLARQRGFPEQWVEKAVLKVLK